MAAHNAVNKEKKMYIVRYTKRWGHEVETEEEAKSLASYLNQGEEKRKEERGKGNENNRDQKRRKVWRVEEK